MMRTMLYEAAQSMLVQFDKMVPAQGLGDEDRSPSRHEKSHRCAGAAVGGDHAPHLG
jgi:hypothetical protein